MSNIDLGNLQRRLGQPMSDVFMLVHKQLVELFQRVASLEHKVNKLESVVYAEEQEDPVIEDPVLSDVTEILTINTDVVLVVDNDQLRILIAEGSTVAQVIAALAAVDESVQTYTIEDSERELVLADEEVVTDTDVLVVVAEDTITEEVYEIDVHEGIS